MMEYILIPMGIVLIIVAIYVFRKTEYELDILAGCFSLFFGIGLIVSGIYLGYIGF